MYSESLYIIYHPSSLPLSLPQHHYYSHLFVPSSHLKEILVTDLLIAFAVQL